MNIKQVRDFLRRECEKAGSQKAWADAHDLTTAYVSDVIGGRREPGKKMLAALKLERVTTYQKVRE